MDKNKSEVKETETETKTEAKSTSNSLLKALVLLVTLFFIVMTFWAVISIFIPDSSNDGDETSLVISQTVENDDFYSGDLSL